MTIPNQPGMPDDVLLERGAFSDDYRTYRVRASSADAPDSFQVLTGKGDDIVLIVSGLNSGELKATWGPFWRSFKPNWKIWVEESAFRVFYSQRQPISSAPVSWVFL
ncbi:hypothetical protein [Glycomyces algeriensis]|uniref:Uncharacterized protein n=1 Tax=Glycomyces algeriensis TaxID=256037 RepID=A0A9W6G8P0_9ACTN|nr:hypothetical protein [Glycomyces algeriensis]MDA1364594.1 hypothetical protein [Glycomyces algeriensis]MDR7350631.1 hypothetical protein [Glycomyces algeriensis]GLI43339.1 hypothetical protein GALLR39Z86_31890 [Glycomyces algeriensis]